eukprot:TRINITY_DN1387_c0_g1_i5.p1 TRINITY_DN1387_c0_g1~~TRINITY_DN1387_c0_g1_i5.p1  ORF type:complete len:257 (-),score=59.42 TRINITY_DN1387_c0_g1_i5:59-829(-)
MRKDKAQVERKRRHNEEEEAGQSRSGEGEGAAEMPPPPVPTPPPAKKIRKTSDGSTTSQSLSPRKAHKVVVSFSGISGPTLETLTEIVNKLGGSVETSNQFCSPITHVVRSSASAVSWKVLFAAASCRWVVTTTWLTDSAKEGKFLAEQQCVVFVRVEVCDTRCCSCSSEHPHSYGTRNVAPPLGGKCVRFTTEFMHGKGFSRDMYDALVSKLGGGHIATDDAAAADIVVTADNERPGDGTLTRAGLIHLLLPPPK